MTTEFDTKLDSFLDGLRQRILGESIEQRDAMLTNWQQVFSDVGERLSEHDKWTDQLVAEAHELEQQINELDRGGIAVFGKLDPDIAKRFNALQLKSESLALQARKSREDRPLLLRLAGQCATLASRGRRVISAVSATVAVSGRDVQLKNITLLSLLDMESRYAQLHAEIKTLGDSPLAKRLHSTAREIMAEVELTRASGQRSVQQRGLDVLIGSSKYESPEIVTVPGAESDRVEYPEQQIDQATIRRNAAPAGEKPGWYSYNQAGEVVRIDAEL